MLAVDLPSSGSLITAGATIVVAVLPAKLADRALSRRSVKLAASVTRREVSAQADTRLRLVRPLPSAPNLPLGVGGAPPPVAPGESPPAGGGASSPSRR